MPPMQPLEQQPPQRRVRSVSTRAGSLHTMQREYFELWPWSGTLDCGRVSAHDV